MSLQSQSKLLLNEKIYIRSKIIGIVITSNLPLPLTTQLYQMHGYFAVKGHNFGNFQQLNLDRYVQNTIFGRPITPKLTSEEYD